VTSKTDEGEMKKFDIPINWADDDPRWPEQRARTRHALRAHATALEQIGGKQNMWDAAALRGNAKKVRQ
jgi:hypothetical protein